MRFDHIHIAVVGDVLFDRFEKGVISPRKNPENPPNREVPIVWAVEEFFLGGATNVARNIVSLGAGCDIYGVVGKDLYGREISRLCDLSNIGPKLFFDNQSTIVKAREFIDGKYMHRTDIGETDEFGNNTLRKIDDDLQNTILRSLEENIGRYHGLLLSDYDKVMFTESFAQGIISLANKRRIPVLADPKPKNVDFFKGCTVVCPNAGEAEKITGISYSNDNETLLNMAMKIHERVGCRYIVITCGKDGAFVYDNGKSKMEKTIAKNVVDFTGAGDTYAAALLTGLASGMDIFRAAEIANISAGLVVEKYGTAVTNVNEIRDYFEKNKEVITELSD